MENKSYRQLFEGIEQPLTFNQGTSKAVIHFDNGATTPPLKRVVEAVYTGILHYGPIGRGTGLKGDYCTEAYEQSKRDILDLFGVGNQPDYSVVYVKNATEGFNLLASIVGREGMVLTTRMEHHSNDLPWRLQSDVLYADVDEMGRLRIDQVIYLFKKHRGRIKYLSVTGASNVTGYINPIHELAQIAHRYGAKIIVDGAQLVAHQEINLIGKTEEEAIDFIVFSGHKVYAPYGTGAIVGRFRKLSTQIPYMIGGGTVDWVKDETMKLTVSPEVYEAGSPNFLGAIALSTALKTLQMINYDEIKQHEKVLRNTLMRQLKQLERIILYGDTNEESERLAVIVFNVKGISCDVISERLAYDYGIQTRFGKFCAHPYVNRLITQNKNGSQDLVPYYGEYGMVRISLGLYNTLEEIDYFMTCMREILDKF